MGGCRRGRSKDAGGAREMRFQSCLLPLKVGTTIPRQGWRRSKGKNTPHPEILLPTPPDILHVHLQPKPDLNYLICCSQLHASIYFYQNALCCSLRIRAVTNDSCLSRLSRLSPWSPLSPLFIPLLSTAKAFLSARITAFGRLKRESSSVS